MNKIYSKVWNKELGQLVVASELASSDTVGVVAGAGTVNAGARNRLALSMALALALPVALSVSTPATAAAIFINNTATGGPCGYINYDSSSTTNGSVGSSDSRCNNSDSQTSYALFYHSSGGDAANLSLGGRLSVNTGSLALGGGTTNPGGGVGSMRIGSTTTVGLATSGARSLAIGGDAVATKATGIDSIAVGSQAASGGISATAVGSKASAGATGAVAVGSNYDAGPATGAGAVASAANAIAIGGQSSVNSAATSGIAIGRGANLTAAALYGIAQGDGATAGGDSAIGIGKSASASNTNAVALGVSAAASGASALALGASAASSSARSVAVGAGTSASGAGAVALGSNATAGAVSAASDSVAIGGQSSVNATAISGVAIGRGANLAAAALYGIAQGDGAASSNDSAIAVGKSAVSSGNASTAIGKAASASGAGAMALGSNATAGASAGAADSIALGGQSAVNASATSGIAVGHNARVNAAAATFGIAVGEGAVTNGNAATAIGKLAIAGGTNAVSFGTGAGASNTNAVALGTSAAASGTGAVALGSNGAGASAAATDAIAIGGQSKVVSGATSGIAIGRGANLTASASLGIAAGDGAQSGAANAVAIGSSTTAAGAGATALGANTFGGATASATDAIAIGGESRVSVTATSGIALGRGANVTGTYGIAQGDSAQAAASGVAIGKGAKATGTQSISIGTGNTVSGNNSGAIGDPTSINGSGTYTLGNDNGTVNANDSGIFGNGGDLSTAVTGSRIIGNNSAITASDAFVLGNNAKVDAEGGVSIGSRAIVSPTVIGGVAIGSDSVASTIAGVAGYDPATQAPSIDTSATWKSTLGAVSVGNGTTATRQITGVAAGTAATDAVNVAQLQAAQADAATHYFSVKDSGVAGGNYNNDGATGVNGVAVGVGAKAIGIASIAQGEAAEASGESSIAMSKGAQATGFSSIAQGYTASATADSAIAQGSFAKASGLNAVAIGDHANATADDGVAIGSQSVASTTAGVAGYDPLTGTDSTDTSAAWLSTAGAVSVGRVDVGITRQITGVAAGTQATDAVNLAQLRAVQTTLADTPLSFAGDAGANVDRKPGETVNVVGGAAGTLTNGNIAVEANGTDTLTVKLAEEVDLGTNGSVTAGSTTLNNTGLTSGAVLLSGATNTITGLSNTTLTDPSFGTVGRAATEEQLAIVNSSATAGWNLTDGATPANIGPNGTVAFTGDTNITVTQAGVDDAGAVEVTLNRDLDVDSVTAGNSKLDTTGLRVDDGTNNTVYGSNGMIITGGPSVTTAGINAGNLVIGNVAAGVAGTDAVNVSQLTALADTPLTFAGDAGANVDRKPGETVNVVGGAAGTLTNGNIAVEANGTDTLTVKLAEDVDLGTNGSVTAGNTTIDTTGLISGAVVLSGVSNTIAGLSNTTLTDPSFATVGRAATEEQLAIVNSSATAGWNFSDGTNSGNIAPNATLMVNALDSNTSVAYDDATGTLTVGVVPAPSFTSVAVGDTLINSGSISFITGGPSMTTTGINAGNTVINNVAPGVSGTDAVNVDQLQAVSATAGAGWNITDGTTAANIGPNGTVTFTGDANIAVAQTGADDAGEMEVTLNRDLDVDSVTAGNSVLNTSGLTVDDSTNSTVYGSTGMAITGGPSVTTAGINAGGLVISNVAAGAVNATSTDAVNGSQLFAVAGDTSTTYITNNGKGTRYARTNHTGLTEDDAHATVGGATAVGYNAIASHDQSVAIGRNSLANGSTLGAAAYNPGTGALAGAVPVGEVSIGTAGVERRITNVAAGANATDAVNVSQLQAASTALTSTGWNISDGTLTNTVALGGTVTLTNSDNNVDVTNDGLSNLTFDLADDVSVASVSAGNSKLDTTGLTITGGPSMTTAGINAGGLQITNLASAGDIADPLNANNAVNAGDLNSAVSNATSAGLDFTGNDATAGVVHRDLGQALSIAGGASTAGTYSGNNLKTVTDPTTGAINLQMADAPKFGSVVVNTGNAGTINGLTNKTFNAASITSGQAATEDQLAAIVTSGSGIKYFHANSTGTDSTAAGNDSVAIGPNALTGATAANAIAIGNGAVANDAGSIALGAGSGTAPVVATTGGSVGSTTYAYAGGAPVGTVSVGTEGAERTLTNVAAGRVSAVSTDAVNGSQLFATNQKVDQNTTDITNIVTNGAGIKYFHANSTGTDSTANGTGSVAIGPNAGTAATASNAIAIGNGAQANGASSISIGTGNVVSGNNSGAIGDPSYINADNAYAIGNNNTINAQKALVFGNNVSVTAGLDGAVVLGDGSTVSAATPTPSGVVGGTTYTYAGGAPAAGGVVSVGAAGAERQIQNVAAGSVGANSTDAVNGSQLFATNQKVDQNTTDITNIVTNGSGIKYFHAKSTGADSTADGTDSVAIGPSAVTGAAATNAIAIGNGAVANDVGSVALGADSATAPVMATIGGTVGGTAYIYAGGAPVGTVSVGSAGAERTLTNVAAGRVSATSTDAINGSQLFATNQKVDQNTTDITAINTTLTDITTGGTGIKYFHTNSTGTDSAAAGADSVAIGPSAAANNANSMAMGNGAVANHDNSVALGAGSATTVGAQTGYNAAYVGSSNSTGEVNMGGRQITGVAAGSTATDAVNVSQLNAGVNQAISTAKSYTDNQISIVNTSITNLDNRVANVEGDVANLSTSVANIDNRVTTVEGDLAELQNGTVGMFQVSQGSTGTPTPTGANSVAGGAGANASAVNATALGNQSTASAAGSTALGTGATASGNNSVAIGAGSVASASSTVSVGVAGSERTISNVAAGVNDTDAVNVAQLKGYSGGAQYDRNPDGTVNYYSLTLKGGAAGGTTIHNVAAGTASTDAVNVGQLQAGLSRTLSQATRYTDSRVEQMQNDMWTMDRGYRGGTASAMAMAGLPQAYLPGKSMFSVGMGGYQGEYGMAVGLSGITDNGQWVYKGQVSGNTTRDWGFSVGAGIQW